MCFSVLKPNFLEPYYQYLETDDKTIYINSEEKTVVE